MLARFFSGSQVNRTWDIYRLYLLYASLFRCLKLPGFLWSGLGLAGCLSPLGQEAADLLADIAAGDGPSRLKQTTAEPVRSTIRYRRSAGEATADLYRNAAPARGAVVVVP